MSLLSPRCCAKTGRNEQDIAREVALLQVLNLKNINEYISLTKTFLSFYVGESVHEITVVNSAPCRGDIALHSLFTNTCQ